MAAAGPSNCPSRRASSAESHTLSEHDARTSSDNRGAFARLHTGHLRTRRAPRLVVKWRARRALSKKNAIRLDRLVPGGARQVRSRSGAGRFGRLCVAERRHRGIR